MSIEADTSNTRAPAERNVYTTNLIGSLSPSEVSFAPEEQYVYRSRYVQYPRSSGAQCLYNKLNRFIEPQRGIFRSRGAICL